MRKLSKIYYDFKRLRNVCGSWVAIRWLLVILIKIPQILKSRNLFAADQLMGSGPYQITFKSGVEFQIQGPGVISSIREMYCRDVYLGNGEISINEDSIVLDLGANIGSFGLLALAHNKNVKVISVEPSKILNMYQVKNLELNKGYSDRIKIINTFVGKNYDLSIDPREYSEITMTEQDLISELEIKHINFLKCDIEGGEFELFSGNSKLLQISDQIGMEIHSFAGDPNTLISNIKFHGFNVIRETWETDGSCTIIARKPQLRNDIS